MLEKKKEKSNAMNQDYLCQLLANRSDILSSIDVTSCTSIQSSSIVDHSNIMQEPNSFPEMKENDVHALTLF